MSCYKTRSETEKVTVDLNRIYRGNITSSNKDLGNSLFIVIMVKKNLIRTSCRNMPGGLRKKRVGLIGS